MSLAALMALSKQLGEKVDPAGNKYSYRKIEGADKGHWRVEYTTRIQGGESITSFWERMTDAEMIRTQCFADDYTGPRH